MIPSSQAHNIFKPVTVFAPAKLNLYLHVLGRMDNGYHDLDSLIAFADIGDEIKISPSADFEFEVSGPFAAAFSAKEMDASPHSSNIVVKAVWAMARAAKRAPNFKVTLEKNLPMGAGIGGGSSDAAALIWGLCELWDIPRNAPFLLPLMMQLGADVPVCLNCQSAQVRGAGEKILQGPDFDEVPIVMIYPGKHCSTPAVFKHFGGEFLPAVDVPERFESFEALIEFLRGTSNSLSLPASDHVPDIENVLNALNAENACALARMTGSGSSCFGLFKTMKDAQKTAARLEADNPDWWVKTAWLGRPERY